MSKNHPNDNIYSILGKLEALTPAPTPAEERFALVKEIQESVEAKGSILEGVDAVQAKLARQFAEAKAKPDFLDLDKDGNKKEPMKKAAKEKIEEKAVSQAQQKFMGMVHAAQKGAKAASPEVAKVAKDMGKKDAKDFAATKHKGLPQHVAEGHCSKCDCDPCECPTNESICNECGMYESKCSCESTNEDMSRAAKGYEKYGKKGMQALAKAGRDGASEEELDKIRDQHDHYNESQLDEREFHTKDEFDSNAKTGDTHNLSKHKATKTDRGTRYNIHPPKDDEEDSLDRLKGPGSGKKGRPRKDITKNPRRDPDAPKGARGRPKKAEKSDGGHKLHDLFNRVKASAHDTAKKPWDTEKTHKHIDEGVTKLVTESVNFKRMMEEQHMTLDEMLECMNADMQQFKESGICSDRLRDMMEVYAHAKKQMEEANAPAPAPVPGHGIPGNLPPQQVPGKMDLLKGKGRSYYEEDSIEQELNELARLAGLQTSEGNAFTGKLASTPKGGEFELDGKTFKDTSSLDDGELDEGEMEEGNEFSGELAKAKAQHKDSFEVDGKTYPVKEGTIEVDDKGANPANKPKPKYGTIKQITTQGDDLNRQKKQFKKEYPGDNPTTNVATLESKLAAEYESIKKISK